MSDIRYNQWLHNSGTGGVSQDAGGNIGIGTTAPLIPVGAGNTTILNVGVVTATTYYGDAANLTGLTAGQIPNLAASKITSGTVATARLGSGTANSSSFLRGDQSWAAVTSTTINSNTNNYLITGTGTADTLQGESNITFDGTQLVVQGGSGTQHMFRHSAGWGGVTSAGSAGGSGAGFSLANNYNGTLETKWSIYLDGSNDGLRFTANTPDQTSDEKLRITQTGEVLIGRTAKPNDINKLVVTGTSPADAYDSQCYLEGSETSGAVNTGGALAFGGHDGSASRNWGNIYGMKENATGGNTASYMSFHTRPAGGGPTERLRIKSDGDIEATGNIKSNNLPGNNLVHNGEFAIWQRGTTAIYMNQNKYLADRFKAMSSSDGNGSIHQHTNVPTVAQTGGSEFAYSLRINCTTADTSLSAGHYITINHRIEGRDLRHLGFGSSGTRYVTLSFWQRSPSGTYHVSFRNANYNQYYLAAYTAADNTWEKHEITLPVRTAGTWSTDHSMGLDIQWSLGCGSNNSGGTVGSWSGGSSHAGSNQKNFYDTVGNDFYLTGVQFEKGSIATPFEHKSYGEDLRQCQRYFFTITPPVGFINATEDLGMGFASSANEVQFPIKFPVEMRATPSIEQVPGSNYFLIGQGNLGGDKFISGSWIVNNMSPNCGNLYTDPDSNMSSYIGQAATVQLKNTSARLALRSEL